MQTGMLRPGHDLKIFQPVIPLVSVDMMDDLILRQRNAEIFFHGEPVFRMLLAVDRFYFVF